MKKRVAIAATAATLGAALAMPAFGTAATSITAQMDGAQVVNPAGGDPNGSATLKLRINRVKERICFRLKFSGLDRFTGAFIHKGQAGQIARPIITLFNHKVSSPVRACEHNIRSRLIRRLKRKPGQHYADVTTKNRPNGAVRGQFD